MEYYRTMSIFQLMMQMKIREFLSGYLSKMDTQSKEFWAEANEKKALEDE